MGLVEIDRWLASNLPTDFLKDFYPRAMRRLTEMGLLGGKYTRITRHGFRMYVDRLDAVSWCIHYFGEWEPTISAAIKAVLRPGDTMVDIGGNIGYTALLGAACVGPKGSVLTFEPSRGTFAKLRENLALNGMSNVHAVNAALSDKDGEAILYCMADNELGQASLLPIEGSDHTETILLRNAASALEGVSLDKVRLIKIDVEGAEPSVLAGLVPLLNKLSNDCVFLVEVYAGQLAAETLKPLYDLGFFARKIPNRYTVAAYRGEPSRLEAVSAGRESQDVVLTKDQATFQLIERAIN